MDESLLFNSRRSPVYGRRGMVAAAQPLAVAAGLEALGAGGNAADAAVAAAAALTVTEPCSTGLGGDCFALYYEAATGAVSGLNGSGRAPAGLTLERLQGEGFADSLPPEHPYTITVPGACAGWCDLIERYGRLPLARVLAPAERLAEEGFPVAPIAAYFWELGARNQLARALNGHELTIDGRAPQAGEIWRNPGLARTLRAVAEGGKGAFYQGSIAAAIASVVREAGGCMTADDLAAHQSTWEQPICTTFRGLRVWECPPNGQGLVALLALNLLNGFDVETMRPLATERLHLMIEATRLAFADAFRYVADPAFSAVPVAELLSEAYAQERRRLIDPVRAMPAAAAGPVRAGSDTVYLCAVDGEGNACSFINSNFMLFGTGIVPAGCGFSLQNRGWSFSLDPGHPNALAPRKRPYHTIIPGLATRDADGSLYGPLGVMGMFMQPQGHVQVLTNLVVDGLDPQAALDCPRFCVQVEQAPDRVALEEGIDERVMVGLARLGHDVVPVRGHARSVFGRGQVIRRTADGVLCGGSDPRADGCAMALA